MGIPEIVLLAIGLSMDAFAVSVFEGVSLRRGTFVIGIVSAISFGLFQGLMPLLGWLLGSGFASILDQYGHWVAFALLAIIGGKMLYDGFKSDDDEDVEAKGLVGEGRSPSSTKMNASKLAEILMLSIATSIDALAVGVTFAFLDVNVWMACSIIACTTFLLSMVGILIGRRFGQSFERPSQIIGGLVLIGIGIKIVLEHLLA